MKHKIAIIGISTVFGSIKSLNDFRNYLFDNRSIDLKPIDSNLSIMVERVIKECLSGAEGLEDIEIACDEFLKNICISYYPSAVFCDKKTSNPFLAAIDALDSKKSKAVLVIDRVTYCENSSVLTSGAAGALLANSESSKRNVFANINALFDGISCLDDKPLFDIEGKEPDFSFVENIHNNENGIETELIQVLNLKRGGRKIVVGDINNELNCYNSELLAIIRGAICLQDKFIPSCGISNPDEIDNFFNLSASYESIPWLLNSKNQVRASLVCLNGNYSNQYVILSETRDNVNINYSYIKYSNPRIFLAAGSGCEEIIVNAKKLHEDIVNSSNLSALSNMYYKSLPNNSNVHYFAILGSTKEELSKECESFIRNIEHCYLKKNDYKSPRGSYFTQNPLGDEGKITFVYPGIGNAYIGMGKELFHMFPGIHDILNKYTPKLYNFFHIDKIFPLDLSYNDKEIEKRINEELLKDTICISECGTSYSVLYTNVLKRFFNLHPDMAIGYSMGETSMFASLDVWNSPADLGENINKYPTFKTRLAGEMTALKDIWHLKNCTNNTFWKSYSLMTPVEPVYNVISKYENVYLTMINTPHNVVIAGVPSQCQKVIEELGCINIPFDFNLSIHCKPTLTEYDNIVEMHTLALNQVLPKTKIYSTSCYMPVPIHSKTIGVSIAKAFSETVDFPKLVNTVYNNGSRIFIEVGPQQTCSTWINKILKDKNHIALPMNVKGMSDKLVISHTIAKLFCHKVKLNMDVYFNEGLLM